MYKLQVTRTIIFECQACPAQDKSILPIDMHINIHDVYDIATFIIMQSWRATQARNINQKLHNTVTLTSLHRFTSGFRLSASFNYVHPQQSPDCFCHDTGSGKLLPKFFPAKVNDEAERRILICLELGGHPVGPTSSPQNVSLHSRCIAEHSSAMVQP